MIILAKRVGKIILITADTALPHYYFTLAMSIQAKELAQ
jgi:hypothetical protein